MSTARIDLRMTPTRRALVDENRAALARAASRSRANEVLVAVRCDDHLAQRLLWEIAAGGGEHLRVGDSRGSVIGAVDAILLEGALARSGAGSDVIGRLRAGSDWDCALVVAVTDGGAAVLEIVLSVVAPQPEGSDK